MKVTLVLIERIRSLLQQAFITQDNEIEAVATIVRCIETMAREVGFAARANVPDKKAYALEMYHFVKQQYRPPLLFVSDGTAFLLS